MIDLNLATYTNCTFPDGLAALGPVESGLISSILDELLDARWHVRRLTTHLVGPLEFLDARAELRAHLWVDLPNGQPRFRDADRGMVALVQAADEEGLYGPSLVEVAWLGRPLPPTLSEPEPADWLAVQERHQGYADIPDSQWGGRAHSVGVGQVMARLLPRHLACMVSRRALGASYGCELTVKPNKG